ncbi:D-tyrosyl-tRNA(Tyr) deacylase [Candidatus Woesearchaeota archaeon]|nr:D-tyrosyl-tRNA(Tyr) deacylase [Candidatus Woesearchaeota archaeon]
MTIAIIISTLKSKIDGMPDLAGAGIKKKLIELFGFKESEEVFDEENVYVLNDKEIGEELKIYTVKGECIYHEDLDNRIDASLFVFATTHAAASGIPSLSVHTQGNWSDDNSYGGKKRELAVCPAVLLKKCMLNLVKFKPEDLDYDIIQEVTHHGPYLEKPCMFIEIGSSEEQWSDINAAEVIAKTIIESLKDKKEYTIAVGVGGLHTTPNFKKIILDSDIAIGHVCPKYMIDALDDKMLRQAIEKSVPKADLIILDWKGLGAGNKDRVKEICEKTGLEVKRTSDF